MIDAKKVSDAVDHAFEVDALIRLSISSLSHLSDIIDQPNEEIVDIIRRTLDVSVGKIAHLIEVSAFFAEEVRAGRCGGVK